MKRVVIKVGSHVLTEDGKIATKRLKALVEFLAKLHNANKEVILVSSGAVAAGFTKVRLDRSKVEEKQALAAIGQPFLLQEYQKEFDKFGIVTAQVLLTADGFDSRKVTKHAKYAIEAILKNKIIPIINENDVTATHVSYYFDADILAILSDIDAYYTSDPRKDSSAKPRTIVTELTKEELEEHCTPNNEFATGGIVTKLQAADFLLKNGKEMLLASGFDLTDVYNFLLNA